MVGSSQPLQVLGSHDLNRKLNGVIISDRKSHPLDKKENIIPSGFNGGGLEKKHHRIGNVNVNVNGKQQQQPLKRKRKDKLSSLCKTPPSLIKTKTGKDYRRGLILGEGGFARCFQVRDEHGTEYAAKTVAKASIKNDKTRTKLLSEIKIHKSMDHPNIVKFIDCFEDSLNVYIILEICPNQSLMEMLKKRKRISEPEVRFFLTQIIGAVQYMHKRRVIHRDLKLGNIFFDSNMNLKIGDFGLAAVLQSDDDRKRTICGTPNYIAPEVLYGKQKGHSYEVDIWSIGIIMYALIIGKPPFQSKEVEEIYKKIQKNDYDFPINIDISENARDLIKKILNPVPEIRPSLNDIINHPFFTKCDLFPLKISTQSIVVTPSFRNLNENISIKNFESIKKQSQVDDSNENDSNDNNKLINHHNKAISKDPVKILKADLIAEEKRQILPHSLSPGNTKDKYKITTKAVSNGSSSSSNGYTELNNKFTANLQRIQNGKYLMIPRKSESQRETRKILDEAYKRIRGYAKPRDIKEIPSLTKPGMGIGMAGNQEFIDNLYNEQAVDILVKASHDTKIFEDHLETLEGLEGNSGGYMRSKRHTATGRRSTIISEPCLISKWVDYSNRHGFAYQLSNGDIGVLFNDGNTIIKNPNNNSSSSKLYFKYIKSNDIGIWEENQMIINKHELISNNDLKKKLDIVDYFAQYMRANLRTVITDEEQQLQRQSNNIYLKRYRREKDYIMFQLNDGTFQINFNDHRKLSLSKNGSILSYIGVKNKNLTCLLMNDIININDEDNYELLDFFKNDEVDINDKLEIITYAICNEMYGQLYQIHTSRPRSRRDKLNDI